MRTRIMSEKTINFPIVFHFHQPVDQLDFIYEDVYKKSYEPLVENLYLFPEIKFTLHFSGNLLEWLIENKPEFIQKLKEMTRRNQVEIIGGGYYEPIFSIIPAKVPGFITCAEWCCVKPRTCIS